jgi:hypothetical protein
MTGRTQKLLVNHADTQKQLHSGGYTTADAQWQIYSGGYVAVEILENLDTQRRIYNGKYTAADSLIGYTAVDTQNKQWLIQIYRGR